MKAIVSKETSLILYCEDGLELFNDKLVGNTFIDTTTTQNNAFMVEIEKPNVFKGNAYSYIDGTVTLTNEDLLKEPVIEEKIIVPQIITPRQFRLQLLALNLLDEVEAMASVDKATQIWFEYSLDFQRNHEILLASAGAFGMSDADIDTFFIEASKL